MMTPDELFLEWGAAWATRDADERDRRLRTCCTEDVEFIPPDERPVVRGRRALTEHVATYTAAWPDGMKVSLARPAETHHGWSRALVRWAFPTMTAQGTDIIRVEDGRIATMLVFADPPLEP
jgi:ketosteroid isomerase-like protein